MKRGIKALLIVIAIVSALLCIICSLFIIQYFRGNHLNDKVGDTVVSSNAVMHTDGDKHTMSVDIDFDALREMNSDIYAWIEVPGTNISYPVVQSATDDLFYNRHALDRSYFTGGTIYSQRYNTKTFADPMTVLYGHNRSNRTMFAQLNDFADINVFKTNRYIYIYTPETVYEYAVFAAYPHSNEHLLLCHDFSDEADFNAYFSSLSAQTLNANYRPELFPKFGDRVITLSTCYHENRMQRYLLQGVLTGEYDVTD